MKLAGNLKEDFSQGALDADTLSKDPVEQFGRWFSESCEIDPDAPNAVSLATASRLGVPSVRTVLMKIYDVNGCVFFTNYSSRKAKDLEENPLAAMLFPWVRQGRQVIVRGPISRIATKESLKYFLTRSRGSQLGAWASNQSSVLKSRDELLKSIEEFKKKYKNEKNIPRPKHWSGWNLNPIEIELWLDGKDRIHESLRYTRKDDDKWEKDLLSP